MSPCIRIVCCLLLLEAGAAVAGEADVTDDPADVAAAAIAMAQTGEVEGAIAMARGYLEAHPEDASMRLLVADLLDWDGRPSEATEVLLAGTVLDPLEWRLWATIGALQMRLAEDGPNVERRHGTITAHPSKDEDAEQVYRDEHLGAAVDALRKAADLQPDNVDVVLALADALEEAGLLDDAIALRTVIFESEPTNPQLAAELAEALAAAGRGEEALAIWERVRELDPRRPEPYRALAEQVEAGGDPEKAEAYRRQAAFYAWMAPFAELDYTDESHETVIALARNVWPDGTAVTPEQRGQIVEKLASDDTPASTEILATLCLHHTDHGPSEDLAYRALRSRGDRSLELLRLLLSEAQSTCTLQQAAHALAWRQDTESTSRLLEMLPGDVRAFFYADIAGALDMMGDAQAVPHLVDLLDPGRFDPPVDSADDPMSQAGGRLAARQRAALALGAFDDPGARAALELGLANELLAVYCQAALYRLDGKKKQRKAVEAALEVDDFDAYMLCEYMERIGTPEATRLRERCVTAREAAEGAASEDP